MSQVAMSTASTRGASSNRSSALRSRDGWTEPRTNVGDLERWISGMGGAVLALTGLSRGTGSGLALAALGGGLIYRSMTGHCAMYQSLGVSTAEPQGARASVEAGQGVKVEKAFTINRTPEELYRFWRRLENLPQFMKHLESVTKKEGNRSHWVAKGPMGMNVEWDAEIINEKENELIAWRSLPGADVDNAGSVHFRRLPHGRGTEVKVVLKYDPPAGKVGATLAKLFAEEPEQQIQEDLRRFKQLMEAGEIPTTAGQPRGKCAG